MSSRTKPFIVRFAVSGAADSPFPIHGLEYDRIREMIVQRQTKCSYLDLPGASFATGSINTRAQIDPTRDEQTDR